MDERMTAMSKAFAGADNTSDVDRMTEALSKLNDIRASEDDLKNRLFDIPVRVDAIIGKVDIPISELLNLKSGQVIVLDREIGQPIELAVNGKIMAHAHIVICEGEPPKMGISITSIGSFK
jgi:flagellar motor switch protein FliN